MRNITIILLICFVFLTGCGEKAEDVTETTEIVKAQESDSEVDIDLTTMSSTLVYSYVYAMMSEPEDYVGQTVKMAGAFGVYHEPTTGEDYFAIIVEDATACCAQGIEFTLADGEERTYPDDYPLAGTDGTVVGIFTAFFPAEFPGETFYRLEQAEFVEE